VRSLSSFLFKSYFPELTIIQLPQVHPFKNFFEILGSISPCASIVQLPQAYPFKNFFIILVSISPSASIVHSFWVHPLFCFYGYGCIGQCPLESWPNFNLSWVHPLFHYLSWTIVKVPYVHPLFNFPIGLDFIFSMMLIHHPMYPMFIHYPIYSNSPIQLPW